MEITSVNNPLIKETVKLYQKKRRDELNQFIVEGDHLYLEAKKRGLVKQVFTTDTSLVGDDVVHVSSNVLEKLTMTKSPQGIVAVCEKPAQVDPTSKVLMLEKVQDPGNLGTLMRSALAFGFKTIVLDRCVDVYNDKVLRATQGAVFELNIIEQNILEFMEEQPMYYVYGTSLQGEPMESMKQFDNIALILGNEGSGITTRVLNLTDQNITIKISEIESLNVAVAGSILMHHLAK
ncbi:MAG: TrmH family RNA methyltransferase [Candidatus Izemoplasmataceae bacterium]